MCKNSQKSISSYRCNHWVRVRVSCYSSTKPRITRQQRDAWSALIWGFNYVFSDTIDLLFDGISARHWTVQSDPIGCAAVRLVLMRINNGLAQLNLCTPSGRRGWHWNGPLQGLAWLRLASVLCHHRKPANEWKHCYSCCSKKELMKKLELC